MIQMVILSVSKILKAESYSETYVTNYFTFYEIKQLISNYVAYKAIKFYQPYSTNLQNFNVYERAILMSSSINFMVTIIFTGFFIFNSQEKQEKSQLTFFICQSYGIQGFLAYYKDRVFLSSFREMLCQSSRFKN